MVDMTESDLERPRAPMERTGATTTLERELTPEPQTAGVRGGGKGGGGVAVATDGCCDSPDGGGGEGSGGVAASPHRIDGVDLFIAVFGPALSVISRKWPVVLSELDPNTHRARVLSPGMALDYAREVIVEYRLEELFGKGGYRGDPISDWYVIAWSIFAAREIPFDEANKMAKTLGLEIRELARANLVDKKGSKILLSPPTERLEKLKKTSDTLEPDTVADYTHALMVAALQGGHSRIDRLVKRIEAQYPNDERFSRSNIKRYLQALLDAIPRVRGSGFLLEEAEALDILAVYFKLKLPKDPPPPENGGNDPQLAFD